MTFSIELVINNIISEDLDYNAKKAPSRNLKYPCSICNNSVMSNQKSIECTSCGLYAHTKCDGTSDEEYLRLMEEFTNLKDEGSSSLGTPWFCLKCRIRSNHIIFPFTLCDNVLLDNIANSDSMRFLETLPTFDTLSEISKFNNLKASDIDANLNSNVNCKYYSVTDAHKLLAKSKHNLNIFHSNVNGLETHFENFHEFLARLPTDFDIINITETSQSIEGFKGNVSIQGYDSYFTPSNSAKGGTGIFVKNNIDSIERPDLSIRKDDYESTWIEIKNTKSKNIVSGCIYRHPRHNLADFAEYMENTLKILSKEGKDVYISGDFNIDLLKLEKVDSYNNFYNLLVSFGYLPQIVDPTRVTDSSATIIDHIYTNCMEYSQNSGNILMSISEHYSQFISVKRKKLDLKNVNIFRRDYSQFNTQSFRDDISIQAWDNNLTDVNEQFTDFYWRLESCVDRHAPVKKLSRKEMKLDSKPWITPKIIRMIKYRNTLFNRKKRQPNNENIKKLFTLFRNKVNNELKKSKKIYYKKYFEECQNNIKKTWDGIKSIINPKNSSSKISQLKIGERIFNTPLGMATEFNNFFVNVGPNTERDIPHTPPDKISPEKFLRNRNQLNFIVAHISTEEVLDIIKSLNNKATGPSSIPTKLLVLIPDLIILPLCKIINTSFTTGKFPDALKIVKVIPIHKSGSTLDVNNFRPISLLSIFDKIIEKLMHKRLYKFLESSNILFDNQFGFRKQNSTAHALIQITEQIKTTIENGKFGCGIFIDLRKAFDTVNHAILLRKLEHYGVRGVSLQWFQSYLSNRKQYVYLNGSSSELKEISCGVPQGSVLGPLLFLLYINDLPNISEKLKFFLFADDTNIYYEANNLKDLERTINKELCWLNHWLNVNRLALNISKTNFVVFHPFNKPLKEYITIKINKKAISEEKYVKYLGVLIDSTLSWTHQIQNISKKVARALGVMYRIRPFVTMALLKNIYYSLVYPHLLYGIQVWGFSFNNNINKLFVLQKKIVRMITYNDKTFYETRGPLPHSAPMFKELGFLRIMDIFKLQLFRFIYDCLNGLSPAQFRSWFKLLTDVHNYATRSNAVIEVNTEAIQTLKLFVPQARTTHYGLKSINVYGPKKWNEIPNNILTIKSRIGFTKALKKHFLQLY